MSQDYSSKRRWRELELLQEHYKEFSDFLYDVMTGLLGFQCSPLQMDIAKYLQYGSEKSQIQAQRGQAKTTITGCFAVWNWIQDPTTRVLVVSGGSTLASEISNWIIQIVMELEELACLRPNQALGDRNSISAFDIHRDLKGPEKSPSLASIGITGQLQGKRADLLIADDVETQQNADTEVKREILYNLTLDFTSICSNGKIVYLGTPQSVDSIYNTLPERGYDVRIWTGRYPTEEEEENYAGKLAPYIVERLLKDPSLRIGGGPTGERGKPTDPVLLDEATLTAKEIDQGKAYFQLQHMLDTQLMDADRYPLHLDRVVFMTVPEHEVPVKLNYAPTDKPFYNTLPPNHPLHRKTLLSVNNTSDEYIEFVGTYMYIDPSGGGKNGDELAWAITKFASGYIYLVDVGGIGGGLHQANLDYLTAIVEEYRPHRIGIEKNFGAGALSQIWTPQLMAVHSCTIEDPWESGQKELRIIDTLEPIVGTGRLIIDNRIPDRDWARCQKHPMETRMSYSFFHQFSKITRDRGSLIHDDRLDAVAGACRPWAKHLAIDANRQEKALQLARTQKMMENPLGIPEYARNKDKSERKQPVWAKQVTRTRRTRRTIHPRYLKR